MRTAFTKDYAKELIEQLQVSDEVTIETWNFNYCIEYVTPTEYRVTKQAAFLALEVKGFSNISDILKYMEV